MGSTPPDPPDRELLAAGRRAAACPRCGGPLSPDGRPGATSRADDRTEVCERCGLDEALRDFLGLPRLGGDEWPVGGLGGQA